MKRKFILFLFALTTCLSLLNGLNSVINSADKVQASLERQSAVGPTVVAWCANCGTIGQSGSTSSSGGVSTNGNSRGGD